MKCLIATLLLSLSCCFAVAQDAPRHINFTKTLVGIDGKPIMNGSDKTPLTLSDVSVTALVTMLDADRTMPGEEKFKLEMLAEKIYQKPDCILTIEEIAKIKDRIGKGYSPMVVGAAWRLLDPAQK